MARIKNPTILGAGGGNAKPEETKTVALNMSGGDMVIVPTSGSVLTQVTVQKPSTLVAANIKEGVSIGGVPGSLVVSDVHPTLYTPSISKSSNTLNITNHSSNGGFVAGFKIYSGGTVLATQSSNTFTLTTLAKGKYTIIVKAYATGFNDSDASNSIEVGVYEFLKVLKNATISATLSKTTSGLSVYFTVAPASGYYLPNSIRAYCNGEALTVSYNPYTGAATLTSLKTEYSGEEALALTTPTLSLSGDVISVSGSPLATGVDIYDGNTKVSEESITPEVSAQNVIIIEAEGQATPKLVAPAVTINGATLTVVDSVNGSGDVVNATSYDVYDGDSVGGNIAI